jgi:hypothetical protein
VTIRLSGTKLITRTVWNDEFPDHRAKMLTRTIEGLITDYAKHGGALDEFTIEVSPDYHFSDLDGIRVALYGYQGEGPTVALNG